MISRGSRLENALDSLVAHHTMRDFLYLRPSKLVGGLKKEVSDLLIVFDGLAIPIQLKGQGSSLSRQGETPRRWTRKQAIDAGNQTSGACRTLSFTAVTSDHANQGGVVFDPGSLTPVHGLAIVEHSGSAFKMDEGPKHEDPNGIPIHYLSLKDLNGLIEALGSLPDLFYYLNGRSSLSLDIRSWIGAEQDLYTCYLLDGHFEPGLNIATVLFRTSAMTSEQRLDLQRTRSHDLFARPINFAIEHLHERDPKLESYASDFMRPTIEPAEHRLRYLKMATKLNSMHHRARQEVGGRIVEIESRARESGIWYFYVFADDGTPMVFVVSAMEDRRKRAELLYFVLVTVLLKLGLESGMVVMYPTRDLDRGLLFLYAKDFDFDGLEEDPEIRGFLLTIPKPKFLPIPKAPPITTDDRFESLR